LPDDDDAADDDDTPQAGSWELEALPAPAPLAGLPLFYEPELAGIPNTLDHVTSLAFDVDDRWLDDFSGGFAALDCEGDGDIDLLFTSSTSTNTMYLNDGQAGFTELPETGAEFPDDMTASASVADFDRDGDIDILLLNQYQPNRLLENDGTCHFTDLAEELGLLDEHRSLHSTWIDFDRDGWLDLYLTNWGNARGEDEPGIPADPHPDRFWLGGPDGFTEVTEQLPADTQAGFGMVTAFFDVDDDGDYDILQTNDRGAFFVSNRLFRNDGKSADGAWTFTDITDAMGFTLVLDGMGLAFGDVDRDGDADIFNAGSFETLFIREGDFYVDAGLASGLVAPDPYTLSWVGTFFDPDADGDVDLLYIESLFFDLGIEFIDTYRGPAYYFQNDWDTSQTLNLQALEGTAGGEHLWRAQGTFDINGDGWDDVITSTVEGSPLLFLTNPTPGRNVVQVRLHGTVSNTEGRGAIVTLTTGPREQLRWPGAVEAYAIGTPPWMSFGVGGLTEVGPLRVEWPSGIVQEIPSVPAGTIVHVTEPED